MPEELDCNHSVCGSHKKQSEETFADHNGDHLQRMTVSGGLRVPVIAS